ncbi:MAG: MBL fold metallo-hydrolase [Burkholderiales bacterium]|nr:MBL fold metallo-hydrolase [Burkholderiales bacterium]
MMEMVDTGSAAMDKNTVLTSSAVTKLDGSKFRNDKALREPGFLKSLHIAWNFFFHKPADTVPVGSIPVFELTRAQLEAAPDNTLYRLGHSTLLLKMQGTFWLTDPVFSERASPFQWLGPKRFHDAPISIADLPPIKGVILSHDHYDHLDQAAVMALADKVEHFVTPTGVGDHLIAWGIAAEKVHQRDWWQAVNIAGIEFVATPAQHFSGRSLTDRDRTLWASWVILNQDQHIFFSGDSGYFKGFKEIGDKYGPFDLTLIETGAYDKQWPDVHMQPEESLQAHLDLRGKRLLPIHNGTFDLALHAWYEPFERIVTLAAQRGVKISTPQMGEAVDIAEAQPGQRWWLATLPEPSSPTIASSAHQAIGPSE